MDDVTTVVVAVATISVMVTVGAAVMVADAGEVVVDEAEVKETARRTRRAGARVSSHMPSALR